jgi:hypothetical protein
LVQARRFTAGHLFGIPSSSLSVSSGERAVDSKGMMSVINNIKDAIIFIITLF